jgi:hypothetical protein
MKDSNLNLSQNLELAILWDFELDPKSKVCPYASNYQLANFAEFWTLGRSPN